MTHRHRDPATSTPGGAPMGKKDVITGSTAGFYQQELKRGSNGPIFEKGSTQDTTLLERLSTALRGGSKVASYSAERATHVGHLHDRMQDVLGAKGAIKASSLLSRSLKKARLVPVVSSDGNLSPRSQQAGQGTARFSKAEKVSIDYQLSSVDDLVSQVYVLFDEDMTRALINALDRVARCTTTRQQDTAKVEAVDEMMQLLGPDHYMLLRCLVDRARESLLKLLEEFCSLDEGARIADEEKAAKNGGAIGPHRNPIQVTFGKQKKGAGANRVFRSEDDEWLRVMNRRFKELTESSELDAILKKDFSIQGGNMPANTTVDKGSDCIRFHVPPPASKITPKEKRVSVEGELPAWTHPAFVGVTHLNTIQTEVFDTAFHTSENMMVCAPTGAGKTMVALLVMLRCIQQQFQDNGKLDMNFKMIYVAPMKALAQEMVVNFSRRLAPFNFIVRELTGDMQLTKKEIAESQLLVTTPEKWDVVTRKPDNEVAALARLIIIDEIHLLNDERGPVIEAIVARTLRMMESEMLGASKTRLVGLSATLPNYKDVAMFLHVNPATGLKVFGSEFRPVPLEQTFIAMHDGASLKRLMNEKSAEDPRMGSKKMSPKDKKDLMLDLLAYEEVTKNLRLGYQVMVFVHARKQTVNVAKFFSEEASRRGESELFRPVDLPQEARKKGTTFKGRELASLFRDGLACHHGGLIRYDRTTTEDLFRDGYARVLCCTSTLAWGVNLPAHTVIIRGTEIYDPKKGGYVSLSVLDVLQIFGRAGRPQFDTSGHAIIISDMKQITQYLRLIAHSLPIESHMQARLCDHLNAEVQAGTIGSVQEGLKWLEFTYLWRRIRVNPLAYGLKITDVRQDPTLQAARYNIISDAAKSLAEAGMIRYNPATGSIDTSDIGRIASHYYIEHISIIGFNDLLRRQDGSWTDAIDLGGAFAVIASANEFSQLRARMDELDDLQKIHASLPRMVQKARVVGDASDETSIQWKVTTLLKAYISRIQVEAHSLVSDTNYIVQNAGRIARSLFEIEVQRSHPHSCSTFLMICKCIERQAWDFSHPLGQFEYDFPDAVRLQLETKKPKLSLMQEMTAQELGSLVHNQRMGGVIAGLVSNFPLLDVSTEIQPITCTILRVKVTILPRFTWSSRYHGGAEHYWLFMQDSGNNFIFHHEKVILQKKDVLAGTPVIVNLTVPIIREYGTYMVKLTSDRWLGCESCDLFSVKHLHLPDDVPPSTKLLPIKPLSKLVIPEAYRSIYRFEHMNAIQSQVFHALYHSDENVFLGAPTGSGKTVCAELSVLRVLTKYPGAKIVYIAPLKALVKERLRDWGDRFGKQLGKKVVELSGDVTPDISALVNADILCTTPEKWDGISRNWQTRSYVTSVKLVIFDEIHMLGNDRGPILEVIVSRMRYIGWHQGSPIRLVGLSTAVANPGDLGAWLGVEKRWAMFNFEPSVRPVPMRVHIAGYPGRHYCPRMATMNKPTYNAIVEKSPTKPVIVFVSSRRQTRLTALALINFLVLEGNTAKFVRMSVEELEETLINVEDPHLKHCIQFGIAIHHAGLCEGDKAVVENAFRTGRLQILVATSTLAWGVNFPAHLVIVKGTEYYDGKSKSYVDMPITDVLQMIGRAGRPQFDTEGIAQLLCHEPKKGFYRKFLYDPFPVESMLNKQLHVHINAEIVSGSISTRQDAVDYLTWTFLFRRLVKNPTYYGVTDPSPKALTVYLSGIVSQVLRDLEEAKCIEPPEDPADGGDPNILTFTVLGKLCSYYYLSHLTAGFFDSKIEANSSHEELLRLMCDAQEFADLPVRHNEDKLNMDLARKVPLGIDARNADSAHVKAFLMFQAHFERAPLPISDYYTDQRSAMDNSVRVLQSMVDIAGNSGHLYATLRSMELLQCIIQGRWWYDNSLLQMPHITEKMLPLLAAEGIEHIAHLANATRHITASLEKVLKADEDITPAQRSEVMYAARRLPLIDVQLSLTSTKVEPDSDDEDDEGGLGYELTVDLVRLSETGKYIVAPQFAKQKDEQYWIVVGHEATGELVAMKRLNRLWKRSSVTLKFEWDDEWIEDAGLQAGDAVELQVYVVCDSFIGLNQQYGFKVDGKMK